MPGKTADYMVWSFAIVDMGKDAVMNRHSHVLTAVDHGTKLMWNKSMQDADNATVECYIYMFSEEFPGVEIHVREGPLTSPGVREVCRKADIKINVIGGSGPRDLAYDPLGEKNVKRMESYAKNCNEVLFVCWRAGLAVYTFYTNKNISSSHYLNSFGNPADSEW